MLARLACAITLAVLAILPVQAADTVTFTDDLGRQVEIPAHPKRIATLDDLRLTNPVLELGIMPVASHGRTNSDGSTYIRSAKMLFGVDYDNTDIAFLGNEPLDIEALAAAQPDLIITLVSRNSPLEQLELIAPTIVFDEDATDRFVIYDRLAKALNAEDALARLKTRYQAQLAQLRRIVDTSSYTASVIMGEDGNMLIHYPYGSLGRVLIDAGFGTPDLFKTINTGRGVTYSAEYLPEIDADIIFDTYRGDRDETPADADARMKTVLPNYCDQLWACTHGQYYRIPRDEAYAISYQGLSIATNMLMGIFANGQIEHR